jgi:AbrB family looped-hinge helix DNA binding protein
MELRIDKAGRVVIPKPLRERLGFKPDTELEAVEQPDSARLMVNFLSSSAPRLTLGSLRAARDLPVVPMLVGKLGGGSVPALGDEEYDRMVVVTTGQGKPSVLTLRYGDAAR